VLFARVKKTASEVSYWPRVVAACDPQRTLDVWPREAVKTGALLRAVAMGCLIVTVGTQLAGELPRILAVRRGEAAALFASRRLARLSDCAFSSFIIDPLSHAVARELYSIVFRYELPTHQRHLIVVFIFGRAFRQLDLILRNFLVWDLSKDV
jgi:hypothetical protein